MSNKKDKPPLLVVVSNDRWDAYGPPTHRNIFLTEMLKGMGGVNESVPPGSYHFNIRRVGFRQVATLLPAE